MSGELQLAKTSAKNNKSNSPTSSKANSAAYAKRFVLLKMFEQRRLMNAQYSLRAFARDLGISHTLLSLIIKGKREVSNDLSDKLLATSQLTRDDKDILKMGRPIAPYKSVEKMDLEKFALISDWIHYAILSLLETPDFQWDVAWVAQRLGQTTTKVQKAMSRLLKIGLVQKDDDNKYYQSVAPIVIENKKSTIATRYYNKLLMQKAIHAMENLPFEVRDLSSTVFAVEPKYIPYAVERIRAFRRELSRELESLGQPSEVYALTVQIFPLSVLSEKISEGEELNEKK